MAKSYHYDNADESSDDVASPQKPKTQRRISELTEELELLQARLHSLLSSNPTKSGSREAEKLNKEINQIQETIESLENAPNLDALNVDSRETLLPVIELFIKKVSQNPGHKDQYYLLASHLTNLAEIYRLGSQEVRL